MQRKLVRFALSAVMIVTALFHATPAMATDPVGFTSTTIAKGQFGDIDAFSKFVQPVAAPDSTKREIWLSRQKTKGLSDGYVLNNVWQPGGSTGWHTHLSHTLIIVTAGAVTQYQADDPTTVVSTCTLSETKALSRHKSSPSGSFQQVSRVGLTPQTRGTAISDERELICTSGG